MGNKFTIGDYVSCKKWSGEPILGIYCYEGRNGDHFIVSENNRRWNIKPNDIRLANPSECETIKKKIEPKMSSFKTAMIEMLTNNRFKNIIDKRRTVKKEEETLIELMTMANE